MIWDHTFSIGQGWLAKMLRLPFPRVRVLQQFCSLPVTERGLSRQGRYLMSYSRIKSPLLLHSNRVSGDYEHVIPDITRYNHRLTSQETFFQHFIL